MDSVAWYIALAITFFIYYFYHTALLSAFLSRTLFNLEYPEYYKLKECTMSPSSIIFKIILEENGRAISLIRICVLVCFQSYFLCFWLGFRAIVYSIQTLILLALFSSNKIKKSSILKAMKWERKFLQFSLWFPWNTVRPKVKSVQFATLGEILSYPFNIKLWKRKITWLYIKYTNFLTCAPKCASSVLAVLVCFLYACILFPFLVMPVVIICFLFRPIMVGVVICGVDIRDIGFWTIVRLPMAIYAYIIFVLSSVAILFVIESFLLGFFLNLIYFFPYFAFFSVLTFYCCSYWKTMEEKYFVLKRLIYEACQETEDISNGCIPNKHPELNEEVLPVVSKELYDKIREELLPYDTNLSYFALKILWTIAFSFGIFKLINVLNEFNVTGLVQIVVTASLGVMPHILNTVALKTSEEMKKAGDEKLKMKVKYMVDDLTREDPELARTMLIIEEDDKTIDDEQSLRLLVQENNETTSDENIQNPGNASARSDFTSYADHV